MTEKIPSKKGSPMSSVGAEKAKLTRKELEAEIDQFAEKVHSVIETARSKMTDEERRAADAKAKAVFSPARAKGQRTA